ncbi:testis-expressed protein 22 [Acinonyx jubatus]|uniref:Testis-expressed protein 22 n=1 Tax=Acinonyx jubatus TaxID=32536 RepID=A0ABM3QAU9_ACIJB|nr:testis-expressed protein 22 [Acinonyx jubatus]
MVPPPDLLRCALLTPALIRTPPSAHSVVPAEPLESRGPALGCGPGGVKVPRGRLSAGGTYPPPPPLGWSQGSPGGADKQAEGLDMDSRKHLANASLGKKSGLPLPQELGQPPPPVSATTAWSQPGAQSGGQQVLQTQDWFFKASKTHILRRLEGLPVARVTFPTRVHREALRSSRRAVSRAGFLNFLLCNLVCGFFSNFPAFKTSSSQDRSAPWILACFQVCQPAESGRRSHRWSVSIDERRRLAVQGGRERPGTAGPPSHSRDRSRLVAQLVSEDVDKDVLLPHAPRPSEAANAFQAFLAPSAPFWQTVTLEAQLLEAACNPWPVALSSTFKASSMASLCPCRTSSRGLLRLPTSGPRADVGPLVLRLL